MKKVSFIIPVYNATPFIEKCLNSIFSLDIPEEEMEIICVDDKSTDDTTSVISSIAKKHPSVVLLRHSVNKRQGGGSNTAIKYAHGEYAVFMDQDDEIVKYDLLSQIEHMRKNDIELMIGRAVCVDEKGNKSYWANYPKETPIVTGPQFFRDEMINRVAFGAVWIGIYKTELLRRTEPFVENMIYEDTDWCYRCMYNAKSVQYRPVDIYLYHNNPTSSSHNVTAQKLEWRVRLGLRIYFWSQKVEDEKEWVHISSDDFYTWNLRGMSHILKMSIKERSKFYKSFSRDEYEIMKSWPSRYWQMKLIQYPVVSQVLLLFLSPAYRIARSIKHFVKRKS